MRIDRKPSFAEAITSSIKHHENIMANLRPGQSDLLDKFDVVLTKLEMEDPKGNDEIILQRAYELVPGAKEAQEAYTIWNNTLDTGRVN